MATATSPSPLIVEDNSDLNSLSDYIESSAITLCIKTLYNFSKDYLDMERALAKFTNMVSFKIWYFLSLLYLSPLFDSLHRLVDLLLVNFS